MAYRIITPSMDCTNELEINALEEQVMQLDLEDLEDDADVFHDDIKQEKPVREKGDSSSRKKRRRRKSGSVRDTSFSEEPSALTNERDVQKPESSSPLPDETVVDKKEEVNGVANSAPEEKSSLYQVLNLLLALALLYYDFLLFKLETHRLFGQSKALWFFLETFH